VNAAQLIKQLSALENPEQVQVLVWSVPGLTEAGELEEAQTIEIRHGILEGTPVGSVVLA
jgi:hypothetical protein